MWWGRGKGGIQDGSPGPDLKDHVVVSSSDQERKAGGQTCLEGKERCRWIQVIFWKLN